MMRHVLVVLVATALLVVPGDGYRLEKIAEPRAAPDAAAPEGPPVLTPPLPKEIPEPFAKLLDRSGLRLVALAPNAAAAPADAPKKETMLCELWLRAELPLAEKPGTELGVKQPRLVPGAFVGAIRTSGATNDYRDQPIAAGVYALRYFYQPADGDHQGTSDSRDFLILTGFEQDRDPAVVADQAALVALAKPVSPSDHPLVLYVAAPPEAAAPAGDAPRFFQRPDVDEWAAELHLAGKAPGAAAPEKLRLGLVLVGHTAH